ncbi:hypothetical protein IMCC9480_3909 [Oxalobacteraceae bacterium IMCC9480]|nr:hypothetical protein IMCC9480_3909 [Oxalobacteraceae bacterium IMCC9480]
MVDTCGRLTGRIGTTPDQLRPGCALGIFQGIQHEVLQWRSQLHGGIRCHQCKTRILWPQRCTATGQLVGILHLARIKMPPDQSDCQGDFRRKRRAFFSEHHDFDASLSLLS